MLAVAAWLSPVVLAAIVTRVVEGDAAAPALVAGVALAPLVAMLGATAPADRLPRARGAGDAALVVALLLILAANLVVIADVLRGLGVARSTAIALGPAVALVVIVTRIADGLWRWALPVGLALVLAPLVLVGLSYGGPWAAWMTAASRPALTFGEHSAWVTGTRPLSDRATLDFDEVHRVVAGAPTTLRVLERQGTRPTVREWHVAAGDAVTLRPGDELMLEAGTPVRFEAGRRIPGAPPSGAAWAEGAPQPSAPMVLGLVITLVGGALALVPSTARPLGGPPAMLAAGALVAFVLGAVVWGVYGIALAPEITLPSRGIVPLPELAGLLGVPVPGAHVGLPTVVAAGLGGLLVAAALAWRARFTDLAAGLAVALGRPTPSKLVVITGAATVAAGAGALAARGGDPWPLFSSGLGIAAACAAAPRIARGGAIGEAAGAIVGAVAFVAALVLGAQLGPGFVALEHYPALAAVPLAWLVARVARE